MQGSNKPGLSVVEPWNKGKANSGSCTFQQIAPAKVKSFGKL